MRTQTSQELIIGLTTLLGAGNVSTGEEARAATAASWSPEAIKARQAGQERAAPLAVVLPADTREIATLMGWAGANGVRLIPVGGGSNTVGSTQSAVAESRPVVAVQLARLQNITWDQTALTVTVGAGVVLADLEAQLNAHGFTLGSLPQSARLATAGGAVASEAWGLFAAGYGGFRDSVRALEAVLPSGETILTGTAGAGIRTLHHLLIGTEGAFGIVTQVTLAMRSLPEVRAWCAFAFARTEDAFDALRLIYRSDARPACLRFYDATAASERFGAIVAKDHSLLLFGVEGSEVVQTGVYQTVFAVCKQIGGVETPEIDGDAWLETEQYRTDTFAANGRPGGIADVISLYEPWQNLAQTYAGYRDILAPLCDVAVQSGYADPHGIALDFHVRADAGSPEAALPRHAQIVAAVAREAEMTGVAHVGPHHYGIGQARRAWVRAEPRTEGYRAALRAMKAALDPARILPDTWAGN